MVLVAGKFKGRQRSQLEKQHRSGVELSERLASLGIMEGPIEPPWNITALSYWEF